MPPDGYHQGAAAAAPVELEPRSCSTR
jgi:hypothetical protein